MWMTDFSEYKFPRIRSLQP